MKILLFYAIVTSFVIPDAAATQDSQKKTAANDAFDAMLENLLQKAEDSLGVERPDVFFNRGKQVPCHENGVVASWCDSAVNPSLECAILPDFDEYGCSCLGNAASCPEDCVGGTPPEEKTHYGIRCGGIPRDEPNYVLKSKKEHSSNFHQHVLDNRGTKIECHENGVVASWCNSAVNEELECVIFPASNEYGCSCLLNAASCPEDCFGGIEPIEKTHNGILCKGIPEDEPNYVLTTAK